MYVKQAHVVSICSRLMHARQSL